ncbi:MAG: hypothetical protein KatS3mg063_2243 [Tepidiforma sp.]|uniref:RNA polymerase sigma factor n=1 Tax=Tepidiforma sp. TaxID=2682230 RepID=UPI0021DE0D7D|nr:sigma-70 family RNA polymerase sigma factor [Tepidiforma sp.]GIW16390.1 MAG: hypothetical protein KatS3mg063_2243 [Tepidiforma sp.]
MPAPTPSTTAASPSRPGSSPSPATSHATSSRNASAAGPSDDLEAADLTGQLAEADPAPAVHLRSDLARALAELTEDQREVVRLRFILDKSVAETAILMERSEDAVKNLQRRALAALQRALGGEHYLSGGGAS